MDLQFSAPEYHPDGMFRPARFRMSGDTGTEWRIEREGRPHLVLGPGYRLVHTRSCGVCSTDLSRHHLPFPLPQITGHEAVAVDEAGAAYVVEINASHRARRVNASCAYCAGGLDTHCPDRLVLGIHDLPGGFGPYMLAPQDALVPIPASIPLEAAAFAEPLAAALHAVEEIRPRRGDTIAVLGPRKLGMLVLAALAAYRRRESIDFEIVALVRREEIASLARLCGADRVLRTDGSLGPQSFDVVVDTSGSPQALELAVKLARREVHLKSTHGLPSAGLHKLTALVVDEIALGRFPDDAASWRDALQRPPAITSEPPLVAWLARGTPPTWLRSAATVCRGEPAELLQKLEAEAPPDRPARADVAVVDDAGAIDLVIRPLKERETALVRPRGVILIAAGEGPGSPLVEAIRARDLRLGSTRCGRLPDAIRLMAGDASLKALPDALVTHHFTNEDMNAVFAAARSPECVKALVHHES